MTDGEQDPELESWERTKLKHTWKQEAAQRRAAGLTLREQRRQERMLTVPLAPATTNAQPTTASLAVVPSQSSAPPPSAATSYNRVRISILAVVILVLFLIWIRRR